MNFSVSSSVVDPAVFLVFSWLIHVHSSTSGHLKPWTAQDVIIPCSSHSCLTDPNSLYCGKPSEVVPSFPFAGAPGIQVHRIAAGDENIHCGHRVRARRQLCSKFEDSALDANYPGNRQGFGAGSKKIFGIVKDLRARTFRDPSDKLEKWTCAENGVSPLEIIR